MSQIEKRVAKLEQSAPDNRPERPTAIVYEWIDGGFQEGRNVAGHPNYEGEEKWPLHLEIEYLPGHPLFNEPRKRYPWPGLPPAESST
jgi:hypothetical protein